MSSISGMYAPLPQSISDSDSERDFHMDNSYPPSNHFKENKSDQRKIHFKHEPFMKQCHDKSPNIIEAKVITPEMSTRRKVAFIISIIMTFLPLVVFLFVLPCDVDTCPVKIVNWETQQEGVEMKGNINLFFERVKKHFNLAVQYIGDMNSPELLKNGIISFLGNNGGVNWYYRQIAIPEHLDCSLLDVDSDKIGDCLLLDERGLKAVEVGSGQTIWHVHSHEDKTTIENLQFPVLMKDMNQDGVDELLSIYQQKYLLVICGRTGKALSNIMVNNCNTIENLQTSVEYIGFQCFNGTSMIHMRIRIIEIKRKLFNISHVLDFEKNTFDNVQMDFFELDQYMLNVENIGSCPKCHSYIKLLSSENKVVYTKLFNKSHIMKPSKFRFGSTNINSISVKKHIQGYIVKVWEWHYKFNPKFISNDPLTFKEKPTNSTIFGNHITEKIILITFNSTDYNVIEASSSNITQLCFVSESSVVECQPDYKNQECSILIADLDRDGSQELIYYSSSFYLRENFKGNTNPWQLISTIKLLKLESELPKLYNSKETFGIYPNY